MAQTLHPFYEAHRGAMEAAMHQRLDLAGAMLSERARLSDVDGIRRDMMDEFGAVLVRLPYVGGAASRMSDFFMRLIGFIALSRVLRRRGVPLSVIGDIARETYKAQLLAIPEAERLASGHRFMSPENQALLREQAARSRRAEFPEDFVYDFIEPGDGFEFGIDYRSCGFCAFAALHGDGEIVPNICGLDFEAYAAWGIRLTRTRTLAGGASHCDFRFSRLPPDHRPAGPPAPTDR